MSAFLWKRQELELPQEIREEHKRLVQGNKLTSYSGSLELAAREALLQYEDPSSPEAIQAAVVAMRNKVEKLLQTRKVRPAASRKYSTKYYD